MDKDRMRRILAWMGHSPLLGVVAIVWLLLLSAFGKIAAAGDPPGAAGDVAAPAAQDAGRDAGVHRDAGGAAADECRPGTGRAVQGRQRWRLS